MNLCHRVDAPKMTYNTLCHRPFAFLGSVYFCEKCRQLLCLVRRLDLEETKHQVCTRDRVEEKFAVSWRLRSDVFILFPAFREQEIFSNESLKVS